MNDILFSVNPQTLFYILLTVLITFIVSTILRSFIKLPARLDNRRGRAYVAIVRNTISIIVYAIALHVIFGLLNINLAPLLASAGIVGLSIGMGAKPLIEDLIGGITFLSQDSIAMGDDVEIDGTVGKIEKIGFRTLDIRAKDGSLHIIPNGMVKKVINYSRKGEVVISSAPQVKRK
ncbi:MAG TPA: mechanosensitive ion channel domain-containing protein [Candidatus Limnocylindrales bacterium]|nr:mechanosensitive ion channel domain-containing protein [Candidatus Limnocylindrales bacterium]